MVRRLVISALLALVLAAPAQAQRVELWPGVTYEQGVQLTPAGPVVLSIITGPRPGGTTTLEPVLSSDSVLGRETLTQMQRSISHRATVAGVNGDYSAFADGRPSGIVVREGQLLNPPSAGRVSAGVTVDGTLDIRRVAYFGTWRGTGPARVLNRYNKPAPENGTALYTSAWAAATPATADSAAVVLFPFPNATPGIDLDAPVVEVLGAGQVPIPPGGAVLVARGRAAAALQAEAPLGTMLRTQVKLRPEWPDLVSAIGGGPQIVRDGVPVFRAGEEFLASQLGPRAPRTGVGQLRDGRIVLVAVDGRQPGYSVGLTNFQLAQALVRLGAVTGMALDGGGSTAIAFDGALLNRPSDGRERPVGNALMFLYTGVYVPPPPAAVSPNGDGVDDDAELAFKVVRPSTVTVTVTAPDGSVAFTETSERQPGAYPVAFPPPVAPPVESPPPTGAAARRVGAAQEPPAEGRWQLRVEATDDIGRATTMTRALTVDTTLGFLRTERRRLYLPPTGRDLAITWRLGRPARVTVRVEAKDGTVVRTLAQRRFGAGDQAVVWNGLGRDRKPVKGGVFVARVVARSALGRSELSTRFAVQRIAAPKAAAGTMSP